MFSVLVVLEAQYLQLKTGLSKPGTTGVNDMSKERLQKAYAEYLSARQERYSELSEEIPRTTSNWHDHNTIVRILDEEQQPPEE